MGLPQSSPKAAREKAMEEARGNKTLYVDVSNKLLKMPEMKSGLRYSSWRVYN